MSGLVGLAQLQQLLQSINGVQAAPVRDFLVDRAFRERHAPLASSHEALLLRQNREELHVALFLDESVLAQLGNRVEHALRAFTPDDADNLRKTARTFPMSDFYDVEKMIPALGIGYGETKIVECHDFFRAVVDGAPASPDFGDGYQIARICEAIEESAASGEWTSVPALEPVTT